MKVFVQFQGSSKHFSNPGIITASFAAQDGTNVNMQISSAAEAGLRLGTVYEIEIREYVESQPVDIEANTTNTPQGGI